MAAVFKCESRQVPGTSRTVYLKWIEAKYSDLTIANIGAHNCFNADNSSFGVNGTFFCLTEPWSGSKLGQAGYVQNDIYRMSIINGQAVRNKGLVNFSGTETPMPCCSLIMSLPPYPSGYHIFCDKLIDFSNYSYLGNPVTLNNIRFALGGISLNLTKTYTNADAYYADIDSELGGIEPGVQAHRTAIIYVGNRLDNLNDTILLTVFSSDGELVRQSSQNAVTLYQLRQIILEKWGPLYHGIIIDGGTSTQIVYKENGERKRCLSVDSNNIPRNVQTMIRVPM